MKENSRLRAIQRDSRDMAPIYSNSVDLVVTSPPYPMIAMWDELFAELAPDAIRALDRGNGKAAFEAMHAALDPAWREVARILRPGGIACINIGDAVRTVDDSFALYPNHIRIMSSLMGAGLTPLPAILWRKPTNAPNKFMGSGMLPAGAYVTLEHEYILILRKNPRRTFGSQTDKARRRESAVFWEERNQWFSDVWFGMVGHRQNRAERGDRSGAFPFELAYRLILMFSVYGDTVLDPFVGTGTTIRAALAAGRHGVGLEIDPDLADAAAELPENFVETANRRLAERMEAHGEFVRERETGGYQFKHRNRFYDFPVMTQQETDLRIYPLKSVQRDDAGAVTATYADDPGG